jgi:hypothetical protein
MASIKIHDDVLVVEQSTLEKILSLRGTIRVPLADVIGASIDPSVGSERRGIRVPGTHIPGLYVAGTFRHDDVKTFWNIRRGTNAVVVSLADGDLDRLVIEVDDPHGTVASINAATATTAEE